jgi:hypothetical protein
VSRYRSQVEAALRAVTVTSPTSFAWFGVRSRPLPRNLARRLDHDSARRLLIDGLQLLLYGSFYTQGGPVPAAVNGSPRRPDRAFVDALSRANAGRGGREYGWRVAGVSGEVAQVIRHDLRAELHLTDADVGARIGVRRPKESLDGWPGFYMAYGDAEPSVGPDGIEERVYFNVDAEAAVLLVAGCTRLLNEARVPFSLKVVADPGAAARCDAAILCLERGGFRRAQDPFRAIVRGCGPHLAGEVPALTRPLSGGVSVAEHAFVLGTSFGASRCRLLAEAVVVAYERGLTGLPDRIDVVGRHFAAHGLELDAPYLAPGSADRYEL